MRKFRDIEDAFPDERRREPADLGRIFQIDEQTGGMTLQERLAHHQNACLWRRGE